MPNNQPSEIDVRSTSPILEAQAPMLQYGSSLEVGPKLQYRYQRFLAKAENIKRKLPDVSIVVPNKYEDYFDRCIGGLARFDPGVNFELIRIDGSAPDFTFAKASNQGLNLAKNKYVLFYNDDVIPMVQNWLGALVQVLESTDYCLIGPSDVPVGAEWLRVALNAINHVQPVLPVFKDSQGHPRTVSAFCMLGRKEQLLEAGGFDEGYEFGHEDIDLCLRMGKHGKHGIVLDSLVSHVRNASWKKHPEITEEEKATIEGKSARSKALFLERWGIETFNQLQGYDAQDFTFERVE